MTARKILLLGAAAAAVTLLGGCEEIEKFGKTEEVEWVPLTADALTIDENGVITEIITEELDESYYSFSELQHMVENEVSSYNAKNGEGSVQITLFEQAENGKVHLTLAYADAEDYSGFNGTEFYHGSMINAQLAGYLFDLSYRKVNNGTAGEKTYSGSEVIKAMDKMVIVLRGPVEVHTPGNVLFISTNAEMLAPDDVNATGEHETTPVKELVLPSNKVYRVGGDEHTFEEEQAASLVYIVYDDGI